MASELNDPVFDQDLDADDDDDDSSQTHDDDDEELEEEEEDDDDDDVVVDDLRNGVVLADDLEEDDDEVDDILHLDSAAAASSTPATTPSVVPIAVPSASAVTVASVPTVASTTISLGLSSSDNNPKHLRAVSGVVTPTTTPPQPTPSMVTVHLPQQQQQQQQPDEKKPLAILDDSRRLFQRLWTDEDEIELLRGFLEYTSQRGGATSHQDTSLFYDQIKSKLQLEFNKNQLVEKLRRLKKKYRNVINKISSGKDFSFKSPHDQATFEISSKIWSNVSSNVVNSNNANANLDVNLDDDDGGNGTSSFNLNDGDVRFDDSLHKNTPRSRKRPRSRTSVRVDDVVGNVIHTPNNINNSNNNNSNNNDGSNVNVSSMVEDAVRSCVGPVFKELLNQVVASGSGVGGRGLMSGVVMNAMPLGFGGGERMMVDEKWRKQQILELEVYSKRLELVQEQIRAQLEELRSMGG